MQPWQISLQLLLCLSFASELAAQRLPGAAYVRPAQNALSRFADRQPPGRALSVAPPLEALAPLAPDQIAAIVARPGLQPIGLHRAPPSGLAALGRAGWISGPSGAPLWRVELRSPLAAGLRLRFESFAAGAGEVWVHDGAGQIAGPYSGFGPRGANGSFWSDLLLGDSVIVEYAPAAGADGDRPPFEITAISHLWKTPFETQSTVAQTAPCHLDVSCAPELEETSRAVAHLVFEDSGTTLSCSGVLLNNRNEDFAPYLLTAAHCIKTQPVAESVIAFWSYRTSVCNGAPPREAEAERTAGAILVATLGAGGDSRGDMTLLVLSGAPEDAFFSGWEATPIAPGAAVLGVHHPRGSHMRWSRGEAVEDRFYRTSPEAYAVVHELEGRTEPGSSGSGLFSEPGVVVGALSFGPRLPRDQTACDLDPFYTGYTHFSAFYPFISQYLEGEVPPPDRPPPPPPPPPLVGTPLPPGEAVTLTLPAVTLPTLFRAEPFRLEVPIGADSLTVRAESLTPDADVDLYLRRGQPPTEIIGVIISDASSATASNDETVTLTPGDGLRDGLWYISLATLTTGVDIDVRLSASIEGGEPAGGPPSPAALVSGAGFTSGPIAPGQIVSLFGSGLGPAAGVTTRLNASGRLPSSAAQTVVLFDEVPAPLFFVRADQVNLQVPYQVAGRGSVRVLVSRAGEISRPLTVSVEPAAPGLFTLDGGRAAAINVDGSLNTPDSPSRRGDPVTLYGAGAGLTNGPNIAGAPAAGAPLALPLLPVEARVGGQAADILFAGDAPGFVGLLQVNVRIPSDAPRGPAVPVTIRVGAAESPTASIAVE